MLEYNFQIHVSTDTAMAMVKKWGGGGGGDLQLKILFANVHSRNEFSRYYLVTLPIFAMSHAQPNDTALSAFR